MMAEDEKYGKLPPYYENLFSPEPPNEHRVFMERVYYWGIPALFGGFAACVSNYFMRKPIMSGIQRHISYMAVAVGLGELGCRYSDYQSRERDAILRRYILLHPEDFPEPERKKYRDVLEPWIPVR
ncbi:NADH dehydrogenase (ubiquinone) B14.5 B subunit isoform X1 [Dermacentor variabilis]|uniref:NADH dehydrogenase (ubiquinone) B14.5 B subunit isoform X1 n=2 Tax=Dermacentor variabilis TaxID=34621 RepID=UPI003F5CB859